MATDLTRQLKAQLADGAIGENAFQIIHDLSALVTDDVDDEGADGSVQELVLRALERQEEFGALAGTITALARQRGLFPYLRPETLGVADQMAYEVNRPRNLGDVVFHRLQSEVYSLLVGGKNVILSAPTSFGKSLIIDAAIASGRFSNIVVVVPTIALIDETRRRLTHRFRDAFKIITHLGQERGDRNIYVLTQERVIDFTDLGKVDFFVIDEFYKLDPARDVDRALLLNQAFYKLRAHGGQFYLLGPNIRRIPLDLPERFKAEFRATDYATVVSEVTRVASTSADRLEKLVELCKGLGEQTLIYCASPASARRVAAALEAAAVRPVAQEMSEAAQWTADATHPDWVFVRALRRGIGLHHGKVPRALQQFVVRAFNDEQLGFLVCTSTLIEGVNTKAKNVIVYDNKISTKKFDFFTFNNIKGRSGRMFQHFVGRVFLFSDPPQEDLPIVDIPMFSQPEGTAHSLLIQLADGDLTDRSRKEMSRYQGQQALPMSILRENSGLDPQSQLTLAEVIASDEGKQSLLSWRGVPSWEELLATCELIWEHFMPDSRMRGGVVSAPQLAFRLRSYHKARSVHKLILEELVNQRNEPDADKAVEDVLEFVRYWPTFNFPRFLMALDRIQRHVLERIGRKSGDYSYYAAGLESFFLPAGVAALDEYGIPLEIAAKIAKVLGNPDNLDAALESLRRLDPESLDLTPFERQLVADSRANV